MLKEGRIPMTDTEASAVDKIVYANDGAGVSLTRNDPGESGPVRVEVAGVGTWLVNEAGKAVKQRG